MRALETGRPDRLIDDPYASAFFAAGRELFPPRQREPAQSEPGQDLGALFYPQVVVRTRFYDEYLTATGSRQVVLLAAGLDSRAFRLGWPAGTRLFEVDLPGVFDVKDRVLAEVGARPRCARVVVPVDLREDWGFPLRDAGFDPALPTAWLAEGPEQVGGQGTRPGQRPRRHQPVAGRARRAGQGLADRARLAAQHPRAWQPSTHVRASLAQEFGRDTHDEPHGFITAVRA